LANTFCYYNSFRPGFYRGKQTIESYYENIERKNARKETQWEQRGPVDKQEIEERVGKLKRWGQVLLSLPLDTKGEVLIKDWVTGEETSVNLSQFHTPVEAAKSFFEKAKKTEKQLLNGETKKHDLPERDLGEGSALSL